MAQELDYKDCVTNELLTKRFPSQFELVRYAIQIAQAAVHSGNHPRDLSGCQNLAYQILSEIAENRDSQDSCYRKKDLTNEVVIKQDFIEFDDNFGASGSKEPKKEKRSKSKK